MWKIFRGGLRLFQGLWLFQSLEQLKKLHLFQEASYFMIATATTTALSSIIFVIKNESFCYIFLWKQKCNAELLNLYWITWEKT